jgi:hypothetical protein
MLRGRRKWFALGGAILLVAVLVVTAFAITGSADVVVYNGRSQYGDEAAFTAFEKETGKSLELRGGTAPELYERLKSEGVDTPDDRPRQPRACQGGGPARARDLAHPRAQHPGAAA